MKRTKLFLLALPLVLSLSSCSNLGKVSDDIELAPQFEENSIIEDTKLHEEIFKSVGGLNNPRKTYDPIEASAPAIGVQTKTDNKGTVDESDDTISFRFIAAVTINGDLADATAVWNRAIYNTDGSALKSAINFPSQKAYTAVAENNGSYTIDDYNSDHSTSFTHFVAYTMINIPVLTYNDCYFVAYLTLNSGGIETTSKVVASTIDTRTQFSFSTDDTGCFGVKKSNTSFETFEKNEFDDNGNYYGDFEGLSLHTGESFVIVRRDVGLFRVCGYDRVHAFDSSDNYFIQNGTSQFAQSKADKSYFIMLNSSSPYLIKVYEAFAKTIYLRPNDSWDDGSSRFVVSISLDGETNRRLYSMNRVGNATNTYGCDIYYPSDDLASYPIAFAKLSKLEPVNDWSNKTSNTADMVWPGSDNLFTMDELGVTGTWSEIASPDQVNEEGNFTINEITEPVEIHTDRQKEYLNYDGDYRYMPTNQYPDGNADISSSLPVTTSWTYNVPNDKVIDYFSVRYGKESDLSDGYVKDGTSSTSIDFVNPYLGVNYYQIIAHFTDGGSEQSNIHSFFVDTTCPRNLDIQGMTNCRDLGGRDLADGGKFKQGLIYRTSGKNQAGLVINDDTTEEMVNHLGMKNEIYLAEIGSSYQLALPGTNVQYFYMDWQASDGSSNFSRNAEPLKKFFNFLADSNNYPVFFHCKIGTDRTGLCGTMLNGLLGVSEHDIYQDYLFSNFGNIQGKRYIGEAAGHDNILRYTDYINTFSGEKFQNKVYNCLLSIGISRATLNAVINNLTEGTPAQGNDQNQITAFGSDLVGNNTDIIYYDNSTYSDHPTEYYQLSGYDQSVSYSFNASSDYNGQIVAYIANGNNSNYYKIADAINVYLDETKLSLRDVTYQDAFMGMCNKRSRWCYYPVIVSITNITAGNHTIRVGYEGDTMNVAGISIFDASTAPCYHDYGAENVITPATCSSEGLSEKTCSICGETNQFVIPALSHDFGDWEQVAVATCEHAGAWQRTCQICGYIETDPIAKLSHDYGEVVEIYNASTVQGVDCVAATAQNCSLCNKAALRWNAVDYDMTKTTDRSTSVPEDNGSSVRFSTTPNYSGGDTSVKGCHIVYNVNVPEASSNVGLAFRTSSRNDFSYVFNKSDGDSSVGYEYDNEQLVRPASRYGLKIDGQVILLEEDNQTYNGTTWYQFPVTIPSLSAGPHEIEIYNLGGYRVYIYELQLTGLPYITSSHVHDLTGAWHSDDYTHWKECEADGCLAGYGARFNEEAHSLGALHVTQNATCTVDGYGYRECSICHAQIYEQISALGHNYDAGVVVSQPTCSADGVRRCTCSRCDDVVEEPIPALGHQWGAGTLVPSGGEGLMAYTTYQCQRDGCNATRIEFLAIDGVCDGSRKSGTPTGFMKLNANGNSISYTFSYSGEAVTAKLYQQACMDSWSGGNLNTTYTTNGTGKDSGCNFSVYYGYPTAETLLEVDATAKVTAYSELLANGVSDPALPGDGTLAPYSVVGDCYIGLLPISNGLNTFVYKRNGSMNMVIKNFVLVIE